MCFVLDGKDALLEALTGGRNKKTEPVRYRCYFLNKSSQKQLTDPYNVERCKRELNGRIGHKICGFNKIWAELPIVPLDKIDESRVAKTMEELRNEISTDGKILLGKMHSMAFVVMREILCSGDRKEEILIGKSVIKDLKLRSQYLFEIEQDKSMTREQFKQLEKSLIIFLAYNRITLYDRFLLDIATLH